MIRFTTLMLLLSLLPGRSEAQRELTPALRPYVAAWSAQLKALFAEAGYAQPGDVSVRPVPFHPEGPKPDSSVTYAGFPDSVPVTLIAYAYPQPLQRVATIFNRQGAAWAPVSRTTTLTDELGRVTEVIAHRYVAGREAFEPDMKLQVFPRGNMRDRVDSLAVYAWSPVSDVFVPELSARHSFDSRGRLTGSSCTLDETGAPKRLRDIVTYTAQGRPATIETVKEEDGRQVPVVRQSFTYTGDQLMAATTFLPGEQGGFMKAIREEYTDLPEARQGTVITMTWDATNKDWVKQRVDHNEYDATGRVVYRTSLFAEEAGVKRRERKTYTYGQHAVPTAETTCRWLDETRTWEIDAMTRHHYPAEAATKVAYELALENLFLKPNPTEGPVQLLLAGTSNAVFVYTLAGQLVERFSLPPGARVLDLSGLPSGVYQVRARSDDDYFSGKLVIQ